VTPLDNISGFKRPEPTHYGVVSIEDGRIVIKKGFTLSEASSCFDALNGSGLAAILIRTPDIIKDNLTTNG
jgi:hypothetical protein